MQSFAPGHGATVAFVLKGWPRLSETFIAQEIAALEQRGVGIVIVSLRHPTDPHTHPVHAEVEAPVLYLPEYLWRQPLRALRGWMKAREMPGYSRLMKQFLRDLVRDRTPNRGRRLGQAFVLAAEMAPQITHLHAHFLHTPASVARYAAILRGCTFSISAHARDIWTIPEWEKAEKLASCAWAVTCTDVNYRHLAALAPPGRVERMYHGLDFRRFPAPPGPRADRDGQSPSNPVIIVSVGRAVSKKGYDDLLAALAQLPQGLHWRFIHIGGGALARSLRREAAHLGIDKRVEWLGPQSQAEVLRCYREADLFVLASRIADDGDRDGLPNVLMEAQSQGLACLSTRLSAIPELIIDGETGMLVEPGDRPGLSGALARLIADPVLRRQLGSAGFRRVRADFDMNAGLDRLAARFHVLVPAVMNSRAQGG